MISPDEMIDEITEEMKSVQMRNGNGMNVAHSMPATAKPCGSQTKQGSAREAATATATATTDPCQGPSMRPFDILSSNGSPQNPLSFDAPKLFRGRRDTVLVWNNREHQQFKNVLFRDDLQQLKTAYWSIPHKEPIQTIMGHVQICLVLKPCPPERDSEDENEDEDTDEHSENDCSEGEDIVFQLTSEYVAIKVNYCSRIDSYRNKHAEDPMKEIAAMIHIGNDHPHVLGCREVLFDGHNINLVMPYCRGGDLFQVLQDCQQRLPKPGLSEDRARHYIRQILLGVEHLHRKGVCHRDLSPENVMLDRKGCVVIDMGMCLRVPYLDHSGKVVDVTRGTKRVLMLPQGTCGKLPYMSPEIYDNRHPFDGEVVDVWSCGTILFCMLTGNRSYHRAHRSDPQFYWMTHGIERLLADWDVTLSPEAVNLLKGMLQINPRDRFTLTEVLSHPWFD